MRGIRGEKNFSRLVRGILVGVDEGETMQHLPKININLAIGAHKELMIVYAWNNEVSSLRDVNHIGALYSFHNCKAMANIGIDERKGTENYRGGDFPVRLLFGAQSRWVYGGKCECFKLDGLGWRRREKWS